MSQVEQGSRRGVTAARLAAAVLLVSATLLVYSPVRHHQFLNYDDPEYVVRNPLVAGGLSLRAAAEAFTLFRAGNWHPLTWLSHALDVSLFGTWAGGHHLSGLLLHTLGTLLLVLFLHRATGRWWPSLTVGGLVALHPLHVESVAWASCRKDLLSGLFWHAALLAHLHLARRPGWGRYPPLLVAAAAALMSKPTAVTLPLALLLLDWWPLGRLRGGREQAGADWAPLVAEKIPLLLLSLGTGILTVLAQVQGKAVGSLDSYPLPVRLSNAAAAYAAYLGKTLLPARLAIFHPYPEARASHLAALLVLPLLGSITWAAWRWRRGSPQAWAGWLLFLTVLLPVAGIVQVGEQAMADRYTYLPLTGLFVGLVWFARLRIHPPAAGVTVAVTVLAAASLMSRVQLARWRESETVFRHALAVTRGNHVAHVQLGNALSAQGRADEAVEQYAAALRLRPGSAEAYNNLGNAYFRRGDLPSARDFYRRALEVRPGFPDAMLNMGLVLGREGRHAEALDWYRGALAARPRSADALSALGYSLAALGRHGEALEHYDRALEADPGSPDILFNRGVTLVRLGNLEQATESYRRALVRRPLFAAAHNNLGGVLSDLGRHGEALEHFLEAERYQPGNLRTTLNIGVALERLGRGEEAARRYREALRLDPASPEAAARLAALGP